MQDIKIPTGSSYGENTVLAIKSHKVTNPAPAIAQNGISFPFSFETNRLPTCGTISPTNPNSPEKLTAAPANSADRLKNTVRIFLTDIPNPCAVSSPREMTSNSFVNVTNNNNPAKIKMPAGRRRTYATFENPPTRKSAACIPASGINIAIASEAAFKQLFTATPPNITVVLEALIFCAVRATKSTAATAPPKAAPAMIHPDNAPNAQQMVTAKPAPAFTPIIPGDASLFVKTPCMTAPDVASAAPDRTQAMVLGSLAYQIILEAGVFTFPTPFLIACTNSGKAILALPKQMLIITAAIKIITAPMKQLSILYFFIC